MIPYNKPWLSYQDQLQLLENRGLQITDRATAVSCLERIGYYRLSGYWYAFRQRSGELVMLDDKGKKPKQLKATTIALDHFKPEFLFDDFCQKLDPRTGVSDYHSWLSKHAQLISRSKEEFVKHNKAKYGLPLPIWVVCEVWDFGTLSTLFSGMREQEQDKIACIYGLSNGRVFASWLRSLNYLRNVCAHHSRLWNRNMVDQPKLPSAAELPWVSDFEGDNHAKARCFLLLKICRYLLSVVNPASSWPEKMRAQLLDFPNLSHLGLDLKSMGSTDNWQLSWQ